MKILACISFLSMAMSVQAADIVRYPLPNGSTFPISNAVQVPPGTTLIFQSGTTASPADPNAPQGTAAYWGDTKTQTLSALANIKASLDKAVSYTHPVPSRITNLDFVTIIVSSFRPARFIAYYHGRLGAG